MSSPTDSAPPPRPHANPYWAGFGLGLVLLAAFVVMGRGLGASGAFTTALATAVHAVAPAHAEHNAFYADYLEDDLATVVSETGFTHVTTQAHLVAKVVIARRP